MASTGSTEKLIEDLNVLVRDAEALLQATAGQAGEKMQDARSRAAASIKRAREQLAAVEAAAVREVKAAAASADEFVHEKPWQAVGVAAGIGLLVGLLIGRR